MLQATVGCVHIILQQPPSSQLLNLTLSPYSSGSFKSSSKAEGDRCLELPLLLAGAPMM
jgi:hypothetical protein